MKVYSHVTQTKFIGRHNSKKMSVGKKSVWFHKICSTDRLSMKFEY